MIKFACRCSHTFTVDDDQAGASLQCPNCGLLVDVPTLSDLPHLSSDGTYTLSDYKQRREPHRLHDLYQAFTRSHVDPATGEEIDLRPKLEDVRRAHDDEPLRLKDERQARRPKYDPITGELIRPMDVAPDPDAEVDPSTIPMAHRTVAYATPYTATVPSAWTLAVELLMPINAAVMFFAFLFYVIGQVALYSIVLFILNVPIAFMLLAHYGNVIDDTGPEAKDELPRPLRHVALGDDLWRPFIRMSISVLICYGPAVAILVRGLPWPLAVLLAGVGTLALPAVMLTATTSGSLLNLRPDRVMAVMARCGFRYLVAVAIWTVAAFLHLWTWFGAELFANSIRVVGPWAFVTHWAAIYPLIAIAIYLMHYYCWYLGLLYRRHQHEFPWVLQRHIKDPKRAKGPARLTPYGPVPRRVTPAK